MANTLLSQAPSLFSIPTHTLLTPCNSIFRTHSLKNRTIYSLAEDFHPTSSTSSTPTSINGPQSRGLFEASGLSKRDLMIFGLSSSVSLLFPSSVFAVEVVADEELKMASMVDDLNAYSFLYPMELPSKKFVFKWVVSRKPERYSSAAPLSPDARQRIVSERVDFIDNLIISVSIGPPNSQFLKSNDKNTWDAKDVADSVLSDKSALRVTSEQRLAESSVLETHSSKIDGEPYWYYEYLVRKSPTNSAQDSNLYRHYVGSTAERDGYLYSLNASTLSKQWESKHPELKRK